MFKLIMEEKNVNCTLDNADNVANLVFELTGLWMFASHVREVCGKAKSGDKFEYDDCGITIECLLMDLSDKEFYQDLLMEQQEQM